MSRNALSQRLILRNTVLLVGAQAIIAPLALMVNAFAARILGPANFGKIYLATTFSSLAILFVEWGQSSTLTAMVSRDRSRAGELLGSGLAARACMVPVVVVVLYLLCLLGGYERGFVGIVLLILLTTVLGSVSGSCQDVIRGFERTDFAAVTTIAWQLLAAAVLVPTLFISGRLTAFLIAQAACAAVAVLVLLRLLPVMGVPRPTVRWQTSKALYATGTTFLLFNLVLALQPNLDAVFLSKLASAASIGWQAAARRLTGLLIVPASALTAALYPTLCRLFEEDRAAYFSTAVSALRMTTLVAVPLSLGCVFYPQLPMELFGQREYGAATTNFQILAVFILLVYVTMPLSTALLAANRQRAWAAAQFGCVIVSAVFDPMLIRWFESHAGNGALGVCVTTVGSEILMVAAAIHLMPGRIFDRSVLRTLGAVVLGGIAMGFTARLLSGMNGWVAAPLSFGAYVACLWITGQLRPAQLALLVSLLRNKGAPAAAAAVKPP